MTYEFVVDEILDDAIIGKELGASEIESSTERIDYRLRKKQQAVGQVKKISENKITTFYETNDSVDEIPATGVLKLFTAGDMYIMARRSAARERMLKKY